MPVSDHLKIIHLDSHGKLHRVADDGIVHLGGVVSPHFTINGEYVLLANGSSTGGSGAGGITLQSVYNNSLDSHGNASIVLNSGKDFAIFDNDNASIFFKIDANTGAITITGDLTVQGTATLIGSAVQTADHWLIAPTSPSVSALVIEPILGIVPTANLVDIKSLNGGGSVFKVTAAGNTVLNTLNVNNNITVLGTINGIDIIDLSNSVLSHLTPSSALKHSASEISVSPVPQAPGAINVQQALVALGNSIQTLTGIAGSIHGIEFIQMAAETVWYIQHNQNTKRIQWSIWDEADEMIVPDRLMIIDNNNIEVRWGAAQSGRLILMCF